MDQPEKVIDEKTSKVIEYFNQIHQDPVMKEYILKFFASYLVETSKK